MLKNKHFDKIAWAITALILAIALLFMNGAALGIKVMTHTMGYENRLFDNSKVHTIDIAMDDWNEFIANAVSEEYYAASVVIDGEAYKNVGIRGKGNTSLSTVAAMDSDRYSFKIEFDQYDSSITYHGLDKLSLNNLIQDSTMMKDYLTYTMMNEFDVNAPLCSFVYITVNGEDWGLYLAVEGVEDAFLERNYGSDYGELYKPDSMSFGGGRGNGKDFDMDDFMSEDSTETTNESSRNTPDHMPNIPDKPQEGAATDKENTQFSDNRTNSFDFSLDEETLKEAFDKLGLDQALLDDIDFDTITMETIQSALSSLDEETMQKLMQEIMGDSPFKGGFGGMGSSDVKLQYIDDQLDSYSNIWNNAKTDMTESDQHRLIESLKKLSNNEDIESVADIEQVIRYFVVHNYVCNSDSYTGAMIHNYYLYEENGQMAMIPWDYNLAYGTFQGGNAQSTINTPIDSPVDGGSSDDRPMWNWIVLDETYTDLYHQYFTEFLNTVDIGSIIDNAYNLIQSYVEKDPTAFYTYDEFETGVDTLRQFCSLRSESISMQLENGETTSDMDYVDVSGITLSNMGSMDGRFGGGFDSSQMPVENGRQNPEKSESEQNSSGDSDAAQPARATTGEEARPSLDNMQIPGGSFNFGMNGMDATANSTSGWIWIAVSVLILCAGLIIAKIYKY